MSEFAPNPEFEQSPRPKFRELLMTYMGGEMHAHSAESNLPEPADRHEADYTFREIFNYVKDVIDKGTDRAQFVVLAEHPSDAAKPEKQISQEKSRELLNQLQEIKQFNEEEEVEEIKGPKMIAALETDIVGTKGEVNAPHEITSQFDLVIASKHSLGEVFPESGGNPNAQELTAMYLGLMENLDIDVIGHLNRHVPEETLRAMDWQQLFQKAKETKTALEINAYAPMPDWLIKEAVVNGVPLTIGTDAHDLIKYRNLPEEYETKLSEPSFGELQEFEKKPIDETTAEREQRLKFPPGFQFWRRLRRPLKALYEAGASPEQVISSSRDRLESWLSKEKKDREISWENAQT